MGQLQFAGWDELPWPTRRLLAEVIGIKELAGGLHALWPEVMRRVHERWTSGTWEQDRVLLDLYGLLEERNGEVGK